MKPQALNPFLPSFEYIPDGEAHIFDGRIYLYGSHDKFNGRSFCLNDYVCWSADIDHLSDWKYEGVIFRRKQSPHGRGFKLVNTLFAPDVIRGKDGKFYLYYTLGFTSRIGVAVCDTPAGKFEFLDFVHYENGAELGSKGEPIQFDPSVFADDDGQYYLYTGFAPFVYPKFLLDGHKPSYEGAMAMKLKDDMVTVQGDFSYICPCKRNGAGTSFEGHEFFAAPSMRKFDGKYYLVYASPLLHELCYAVSDHPMSGFTYGGTLLSTADITPNGDKKPLNYFANVHGSLAKINDKYYVFYHRQTNQNKFSRQACAEEIEFKDGKFLQAELTSCGLNGKPLEGIGVYKAYIACQLYSRWGAKKYGTFKPLHSIHPYFTQVGGDREHTPSQHIANFKHGATAGFKYFNFDGANQIIVTIKGNPRGKLIVSETPDGPALAKIRLTPCKGLTDFYAPLKIADGKHALYFTYEGLGKFIFKGFVLQQVVRGNKYE